jgi:CheY-like chemotaxis protein
LIISRAVALSSQTEREVAMEQKPFKMLIADDSLTVHQLFRNALPDEAGVVHAFDGVECLVALDHGVDMAFIDVHMPRMSGMDALWAARIAGNKTFVTLITGHSNPRCVELARKLDAYELLIKPFTKDDILAIADTYQLISSPMRVLLVDDSPIFLKIMRKVLSQSVFRLDISEESQGDLALARCDAAPTDIVFLDINMPGLNGLETLTRLKRNRSDIKVVMISAEYNPAREREALRLGAAAVMYKPFFPTEIDDVIHQLFGLRSPKLTTDSRTRDFATKIHGRTIAVHHAESGHVYQYIWFRDPPYLRLPAIRRNDMAESPVHDFESEAKRIALLELKNVGLLSQVN